MDCREEVAILERRFKSLIGLEDFSADLMGQRLHVKYDAAKLSTATIADAVADTGMRAWLDHEEPVVGSDRQMRLRQALVWTAGVRARSRAWRCSLPASIGGAANRWPRVRPRPVRAVAGGRHCGDGAEGVERTAQLGALDINVLMIVAAAGAASLGDWAEAATVVFLFGVAQALEARTLDRARNAIRALMDLTPAEALVRDAARRARACRSTRSRPAR